MSQYLRAGHNCSEEFVGSDLLVRIIVENENSQRNYAGD
jgi:hypothetical protein